MIWTQKDPTPQLWWESMCGVQHDDTSLVDTAVLCAHFAQPFDSLSKLYQLWLKKHTTFTDLASFMG